MKADYSNTYWCHKGKYQNLANLLENKVPNSGAVRNSKQNPCLEKFRRASNYYYDLYNNGLCNHARGFSNVFGFSGKGELTQETINRLEKAMNHIVLMAAIEQDLIQDLVPKGSDETVQHTTAERHP